MQIFEGEALLRQRLHDLEVNNMAAMQRLIKESEDSMAALKKHRSSSGEWASWVLGSLRDHPSAFEHSHCPSYGAHCSSYLYTSYLYGACYPSYSSGHSEVHASG